jgi:hypothetical protein
MRSALIFISFLSLTLTACSSLSSSKNKPLIYAAGDKATFGHLVYSIIDTEMTQQLGTDPSTARTAQNRFFLVKVSISNSGTDDQSIPAMTLVDDSGQNYTELADGTNVANWLGVVRRVGPAQTEQGFVLFDAPTRHYRLRLTDPFEEKEIAIDMPLDFLHEQLKSIQSPPSAPSEIKLPKR